MLTILCITFIYKKTRKYFVNTTWTAKSVYWSTKFPSMAHINPDDAVDYSNIVM